MENIELTNNAIPILFDTNKCEAIEKTGITIQVSAVNAQIPNANGAIVYKCSINDNHYKTNALFLHNEGQEINNFDVIKVYKTNIKQTQKRTSLLIIKRYEIIARASYPLIESHLEIYQIDNLNINNFQSSSNNFNSALNSKSNYLTNEHNHNGDLNNICNSEFKNKNSHSQISNYSINELSNNSKLIINKNNQHFNKFQNSNRHNHKQNDVKMEENNDQNEYNYNNNNLNESFYDINMENKPIQPLLRKSGSKSYYLPLSTITTFTKEILLKVRVTNKSQKKVFNQGRGNGGSVFAFTIIDEEGTEFPCTAFTRACEKYYDLIEEGKVYEIKGGYIKLNDGRYTHLKSEYKYFLDEKTIIKEIPDDSSIQRLKLNFTSLEQVMELAIDSILNVMGYVLQKGVIESILSKKGEEKKLRKIIICDSTNYKIEIAIWGKNSETDLIDGGVYAFKNAKINHYQNKRYLNVGDDSSIMALENHDASELKHYCDRVAPIEFMELPAYKPVPDESRSVGPAVPPNLKYIKELIESLDASDEEINKLGAIRVKAVICGLTLNMEKLYYPGCPYCKKKVQVVLNGDNHKMDGVCDSCKKAYDKYVLYYTLHFKIKDLTGDVHVDVIGREGEKILFGKTAEELKEYVEEHNEDELRRIASEADYLQYYFLILPKMNVYNDIRRKKYSVVRIEPVNSGAETQRIINDLRKISNF